MAKAKATTTETETPSEVPPEASDKYIATRDLSHGNKRFLTGEEVTGATLAFLLRANSDYIEKA